MTEKNETQKKKDLPVLRGELALLVVVLINSLGVVLMLYSGSGISAISSVPYAFSEVFTKVSLGTWTYIFQGLLVLSLMIMRKKFVAPYLFSFVVGFAFSEMLDVHAVSYTHLDVYKRQLLTRLESKNFVEVTKQGKMNLYTPLISQTDYQAHESQSVLEKLYGNSLKKFVTSLYQGKKISSEEIHELSDFLKEMEDREE